MTAFRAYQVSESDDGVFTGEVIEKHIDDLPAGELLIEVSYSSLNFKDALSASGNKAVTRQYPHTPGIDAAGKVVDSQHADFAAGDEVIVIGYDLGMNTSGGFGQYIRVPAAWAVPCPAGLSIRDSMLLGTAGFTAALCVEKLLHNGVKAEQGEVLVTGASGGVGIIAVYLLHKLGFTVVAGTGKESAQALLKELGASSFMSREELKQSDARPLLKERWAGAVDVVGGDTLFNVIKSLQYGGSVASCGLVQSPVFEATVYPFILRGVNLLGVDSVELPLATKSATWGKLAAEWLLPDLDRIATVIGLDELQDSLQKVLHGEALGRFLLDLRK